MSEQAAQHFTSLQSFLSSIGITLTYDPDHPGGFFQNVALHQGTLIVNTLTNITIGRTLHDAGHIAIVPIQFRHLLTGSAHNKKVSAEQARYLRTHPIQISSTEEDPTCRAIIQNDDSTATAWSYAAAIAANIPTEIIFDDPEAYDGHGEEIHFMLKATAYMGINSLASMNMTCLHMLANHRKIQPFPHMLRWTN